MIQDLRRRLKCAMQRESVMLFSLTTALITVTAAFFGGEEVIEL